MHREIVDDEPLYYEDFVHPHVDVLPTFAPAVTHVHHTAVIHDTEVKEEPFFEEIEKEPKEVVEEEEQ